MTQPELVGRYAIYGEIAAGGMATVHFGRLLGPIGFSRTVAIKRLHPRYAKDPEFVSMFTDEARLAARIQHPNVVSTVDVVAEQGDLFLVMEYVQGESLARLIRTSREQRRSIPTRVAAAIVAGVLHGLHAAHEAKDTRGAPLGVVHRDVSPQNVLVGADGVARVLDFGVAKAAGRSQTTREGHLKGKLSYMAPEQLKGIASRQTDVFAASVVFWETLTCRRLFAGDSEGEVLTKVSELAVAPPSAHAPEVPEAIDAIVLRGLARDPAARFATAKEMALAIEAAVPIASTSEVGGWVMSLAEEVIQERAQKVGEIESEVSRVQTAQAVVPRPPEVATASMPAGSAKSAPDATPARPRWPALVVAGAVPLAILAAWLVWMGRSKTTTEAAAAAPPVAASAPASVAPAPEPPPPAPSAAPEPPSASAAPAPSPVRAPSAPRAPAPTKVAPAAPNCDPPYVHAADGKLVPKPGCL